MHGVSLLLDQTAGTFSVIKLFSTARWCLIIIIFFVCYNKMSSLGFGTATGITTGGVLCQLIALGASDSNLTANPDVTYWRLKIDKCSNFAMESLLQNFNGTPQFGQEVNATINRTGDLIHYMYLIVNLPGIAAGDVDVGCSYAQVPNPEGVTEPTVNWVNEIGHAITKRVCYSIGGQQVDCIYSTYMHAWEELAGKPGKRLREMIGKRDTRAELIQDSSSDRRLYVPLPFSFNQHSGNALPLVSLQYHSVQVHVQFEELGNLIQVSEPVYVINKNTGNQITRQDLSACLDTTYIYLDMEERDRFSTNEFQQLIVQVQGVSPCRTNEQVECNLNFNHPTLELIWVLQDAHARDSRETFDFSSADGGDLLERAQFTINNLVRFNREGTYFRTVQPYQHHSNIPASNVYSYSFALEPESPQPSGSLNFSRIDSAKLILSLKSGTDVSCNVFARSWNVLRFKKGLGGVLFSN